MQERLVEYGCRTSIVTTFCFGSWTGRCLCIGRTLHHLCFIAKVPIQHQRSQLLPLILIGSRLDLSDRSQSFDCPISVLGSFMVQYREWIRVFDYPIPWLHTLKFHQGVRRNWPDSHRIWKCSLTPVDLTLFNLWSAHLLLLYTQRAH